jgi:hypothetical protein
MALTAKQVAARRDGIGGSELGKIMGLSAFGGPLEVWNLKVYGTSTFKENAAMRLGTMMEPLHAERIQQEEGILLLSSAEYHNDHPRVQLGDAEHISDGTLRNRRFPHLLVTPDYYEFPANPMSNVPRRIRELKCVGAWSGSNAFSKPGRDSTVFYPKDYKVQCKAQMLTTGVYACTLDVLVQSRKLTDKFVNMLWAEWQVDPVRVEWWLRDYCKTLERRTYDVPHNFAKADGLGEFVEAWWAKYVETQQADPAWEAAKKPFQYDSKRAQKVATTEPAGFDGGW